MTTLGKAIGLALLIVSLAATLWVAVYFANRPAPNPPAPQFTTPSVPPLALESGTSVLPILTANEPVTAPTSTIRSGAYRADASSTGIFVSLDGVTSVDFSDLVRDDAGRPVLYNPFMFNGTTTVFENQFSWRVTDVSGNRLAEGQATAKSPDMGIPGAFKIKGSFQPAPKVADGFLELYDNSPKDGAEMILIRIPVVLPLLDVPPLPQP